VWRGQVKNLLSKVKLGKEKEVKEILSRDPSILKDAVDVQGNTMLHLAALNGHKRIVKEILRNADHFNPYAVNKKGLSAADLARAWNYPELADYIRDKLPGIPEAKAEAPGTEAPEAIEVTPLTVLPSSSFLCCCGHA
jgi:ankyrin repeat protein